MEVVGQKYRQEKEKRGKRTDDKKSEDEIKMIEVIVLDD
jgi:hypothetical protein